MEVWKMQCPRVGVQLCARWVLSVEAHLWADWSVESCWEAGESDLYPENPHMSIPCSLITWACLEQVTQISSLLKINNWYFGEYICVFVGINQLPSIRSALEHWEEWISGVWSCKSEGQIWNQFYQGSCHLMSFLATNQPILSLVTPDFTIHKA